MRFAIEESGTVSPILYHFHLLYHLDDCLVQLLNCIEQRIFARDREEEVRERVRMR